jgi:uncharacterized protein
MKNKALFDEYAKDILSNELFLKGKTFISHGSITVYAHSLAVASLAFSMVENSRTLDKRCVVRAALLHDFFLYDWHTGPGKQYILHGWVHAGIAAKNARDIFGVTEKEYSCIKTHMWPWTPFHAPQYREGWVITLADKLIALKETLFGRSLKRPKAADCPGQKTADMGMRG